MWKQFMRKFKKDQPPPIIKIDQQKILYMNGQLPVVLNQQAADDQIVNSISSSKIILDHMKDNEAEFYKLAKLYQIICREQINMVDLRHIFYNFLGYQYYTIRSLVWKILLDYLPDRKNKWITFLEANKKLYEKILIDNFDSIIKKRPNEPIQEKPDKFEKTISEKLIVKECRDHPLNRNSDSQWNTFFKDIELWNRIQKDVLRTRKNVPFFQAEHQYEFQHEEFTGRLNLAKDRASKHSDAIIRILFIYAKLHPKEGYCQGMNEIAAILYFSFTNQNTEYERRVSESDAYFCFERVISKIGYGNFSNNEMLSTRVQVFNDCVRKIDPKLHESLKNGKVDIKLFAMRWFMVYMLQEFDINKSLLIWDGLLSSEIGMSKYLYYICLAVLVIKREELMENPNSIYEIQKLSLKPENILQTANNLYKQYPNLQLV